MRLPCRDCNIQGGIPRSVERQDSSSSLVSELFHLPDNDEGMSIYGFSLAERKETPEAPAAVFPDPDCNTFCSNNRSLYTFDDETISTHFLSVQSQQKKILLEGIPEHIGKKPALAPEAFVKGKTYNCQYSPSQQTTEDLSTIATEQSQVKELIDKWNSANSTKKSCIKIPVKSPVKEKIALFNNGSPIQMYGTKRKAPSPPKNKPSPPNKFSSCRKKKSPTSKTSPPIWNSSPASPNQLNASKRKASPPSSSKNKPAPPSNHSSHSKKNPTANISPPRTNKVTSFLQRTASPPSPSKPSPPNNLSSCSKKNPTASASPPKTNKSSLFSLRMPSPPSSKTKSSPNNLSSCSKKNPMASSSPPKRKKFPPFISKNKNDKKKGCPKAACAGTGGTILEVHNVTPSDKNNFWKKREEHLKKQKAHVSFWGASWKFWKSSPSKATKNALLAHQEPKQGPVRRDSSLSASMNSTSVTSKIDDTDFEEELVQQRCLELWQLQDSESVYSRVAWC